MCPLRPNGLAHLSPVSGAAVAVARAVTDAVGGQCSDLLDGIFVSGPITSVFGCDLDRSKSLRVTVRTQRRTRNHEFDLCME